MNLQRRENTVGKQRKKNKERKKNGMDNVAKKNNERVNVNEKYQKKDGEKWNKETRQKEERKITKNKCSRKNDRK